VPKEQLGRVRLSALTAADVHVRAAMAADRSARTVQIAHSVLVRAIRQAERDNLVGRNVAALAEAPKGQKAGRPQPLMLLGGTGLLTCCCRLAGWPLSRRS
jgi:hypothetical protein